MNTVILRTVRAVAVVLTVVLFAGNGGCSTNPATGRAQFNLLSPAEEIQIGEEAAPQFTNEGGGRVSSDAVNQYVSRIGQQLASLSERPDLPWEFTVLDSAVINAFALPGGKVFISRGLMEKLSNEAELAGVLGHEVGHVTAQHIGQQMSQAMLLQTGLSVLGNVASSDWVNILGGYGGQLYLLKFGRDQESEADSLGLRYMTRAGYDPMGLLGVMQVLEEASKGHGGLEILQTHPLPATRIERVRELIATKYAHTQNNTEFVLKASEYEASALTPLRALPPSKHPPTDQAQ